MSLLFLLILENNYEVMTSNMYTMKNMTKYINKLVSIACLVLIGGVLVISCKKENADPPQITNVRAIEPEEADISLEGAGLESWIVIQGQNLAATTEIYFNEFYADFNPAYVTETNIVVQVPGGTPNLGTDPDAPNTLRVVTEHGEAQVDFVIFPPPVVVSYLSNEFARPGEAIYLEGLYFFLVDSIIFPGGIPAIEFETSSDGMYCSVIVPEGATSGPLRVVSASGVGGSVAGAHYNDPTGMICDFDALNTWENWGGIVINTSTDDRLPDLTGNAFLAEASNLPTGTWWVQEMAMPIASGRYPNYDTIASADNIFIKFEMYVEGPWNSGEYRFSLVRRDDAGDWVEQYDYFIKPWLTEDGSIIDIEMEGWITAVIPLSEFANSSGENIVSFSEISDFDYLGCYFQNSGVIPGEQAIPFIRIGIDNIRMVGWQPPQ
jgi:hypothetical protein